MTMNRFERRRAAARMLNRLQRAEKVRGIKGEN
jgi:hypothetical protein